MAYNALDIARYVINYSINQNNVVSNIKLQKLMFYIQVDFLIKKQKPCFRQEILIKKCGAIIEEVYDEFVEYDYEGINDYQKSYEVIKYVKEETAIRIINQPFDDNIISKEDKEIINEVVDRYAKYNAFQLLVKSYKEINWKNTRISKIISNDEILKLYNPNKYKESLNNKIHSNC